MVVAQAFDVKLDVKRIVLLDLEALCLWRSYEAKTKTMPRAGSGPILRTAAAAARSLFAGMETYVSSA